MVAAYGVAAAALAPSDGLSDRVGVANSPAFHRRHAFAGSGPSPVLS